MVISSSQSVLRALGVLVASLLVLAACGDDGGGGLSNEAFCAELEARDATDSLDLDNPEDLEVFNELVDQAPSDIRPAMETFRDIAGDLQDLDEADPSEGFEAIFGLFADEDFLTSLRDLATFAVDECGIDDANLEQLKAIDPDDPASLFGLSGLDDGVTDFSVPDVPDVSLPDDLGGTDEGGADGTGGEERGSASSLGAFLEENYGDTTWESDLVGRGIGSAGDNSDVTVTFINDVATDDAVEACEATVEWADQEIDGTYRIIVLNGDSDTVVEAEQGGSCAAA